MEQNKDLQQGSSLIQHIYYSYWFHVNAGVVELTGRWCIVAKRHYTLSISPRTPNGHIIILI